MTQVGKSSANDMAAAGSKQIDPHKFSAMAISAENTPFASTARVWLALGRYRHFARATMSGGEVKVKFALLSQANTASSQVLLRDIQITATRHHITQFLSC